MGAATRLLPAALAACLAARCALGYPGDQSPFEPGREPRRFLTYPCRVAERTGPPAAGATFVRGDAAAPHAEARLACPGGGGVIMSVAAPDGRVLAMPFEISGSGRAAAVFWADLNADGREDFIALVPSGAGGPGGPACEMGFALSGKDRYAITAVRTVAPGGCDFVDFGDGRCRFVQTSLVLGKPGAGEGSAARAYLVFNILEFSGERVVVSNDRPRFPRWVERTRAPNRAAARLSEDEKVALWALESDRIFRQPAAGPEPAEPAEPAEPEAPELLCAAEPGA